MKFLLIIAVAFFVISAVIIIIAQILDDIILYRDALKKNDSFFVDISSMRKASKKGKLTPTEYYLLIYLDMKLGTEKNKFMCSQKSLKIETKCVITEKGYDFFGFYDGSWNFICGGKYMISIINFTKKYMTPCTPSYLNEKYK